MKVGDLVKYKPDGKILGIVADIFYDEYCDEHVEVYLINGAVHCNVFCFDEVEVISESR
jgi:uncharacterized protein YrrD